MVNNYVKPSRVLLKTHPDFSEKWVQKIIADDPSILGLGDLELKDQERIQPRAGRLDLLLQDTENRRRYEVELQLGATDEAHIIRTIEYWDIEKKRYPQYDHCAVLIAEDITSRFLNVISLFNGRIPLIALQMQALKVGEHVTLVFTTVLDEMPLGLVDEDEDATPVDRSYWKQKGSTETLKTMDELFGMIQEFSADLRLNYNKHYVGLATNGQSMNFVVFKPKKKFVVTEIRLPQTEETDLILEEAGFDTLEYEKRNNSYRMRVSASDLDTNAEALNKLFQMAYKERTA